MITYADACADPNLFGDWFSGPSWDVWRVLDRALFGEPLDDDQLAIFKELTGRDHYEPGKPVKEAWLIFGRRSAKDVKSASIISYLATIGAEQYGLTDNLQKGETAVVQLLALDRSQARVCLNYTKAFFEKPLLAAMVERETADGLELSNGISIQIATNDLKSIRGRTTIAAVLDEVAFWNSTTSVNPGEEVYRALKPGMATVPNAMILGISSPFTRSGLLFEKHQQHYGQPGRTLVAVAPTWRMNPLLPRDGEFLADEEQADSIGFMSEYGAQWRDSSSTVFDLQSLLKVTDEGTTQRPYVQGVKYHGFVDASSGSSGGDSFTAAVAHREGQATILDAVYEISPPFSPQAAVVEISEFLKSYGLRSCHGDRWTGQVIREMFSQHGGINYQPSTANRSQLYMNLLPLVNAGRVALLDNKQMTTQLTQLIRKPSRGGAEQIDHPSGASFHDDLSNAAAGAIFLASKPPTQRFALAAPRFNVGGMWSDSPLPY